MSLSMMAATAALAMCAVASAEPLNSLDTDESGAPAPAALRALYEDYNAALQEKDGRRAASRLHRNMLKTYADALALARTATQTDLRTVSAHTKLIALYLRWAATPQEVAALTDAHEVVAFLVRRGALRTDAGMSSDLREFTIEADEAFANLYAGGRNTNLRLRFAKEAREWKIDLTDLNRMADDIYTQSAAMQKVSQDEALLRLVRAATGRAITDEIWTPLDHRAH